MLTRGETNRALHAFTVSSGLFGAWGQTLGMGTAVFTGYILSLGGTASDIAFYTALASLMAPVQILVSLFSRWIPNKKRWILYNGFLESLFRGLLVAIPFLFVESLHKQILLLFLALGLVAGFMYTPFYSGWLASVIPVNIRARFTSRQTIVSSLVGMVAGVLAGRFVDWFAEEEKATAFIIIFAIGTLFGFIGHLIISQAPYPHQADESEGENRIQDLIQPFRDRNFRQLIIFYSVWHFAIGLAGPLFSVFMLDRLNFSYTAISMLTALGTVCTIAGYKTWSSLVDRFGGKPVLQILLIPAALNAMVWGLSQPGSYVIVAIAMTMSGLIMSGIAVAVTPLQYALLPESNQDERVSYLAAWSTTINLIYAMGPLIGGILVASLQNVRFTVAGLLIQDINIMFFLSGLMRFVPFYLLRSVEDSRAISSRALLSTMFRGNLLSYAFHNIMFNLTTAEDRRAKATFALGKSRNPLAIDHLIQTLSDASPKVRREAARALGETGSEEAVDSLIKELESGASDIRSEAAEALGRLNHAKAIDPLVEALEDEDARVQISAIHGLGQMGGDDVQELLFWHLSNNINPQTFPTLVETLSQRGDHRIIKPSIERLGTFSSAAVRFQLLNSICRTLGSGNQFYHLLSLEENKRFDELEEYLKHAASKLTQAHALQEDTRQGLDRLFTLFIDAHEHNDITAMLEQGRLLAAMIRDSHLSIEQSTFDTLSAFVVIMAMNDFIATHAHNDLPAAQEIFLTVCLNRLATLIG
jgi:MFS family permease